MNLKADGNGYFIASHGMLHSTTEITTTRSVLTKNHAIDITSKKFYRQKLDYIHNNPVRAGWVEREEDYVYSSAPALYGKRNDHPFPIHDWWSGDELARLKTCSRKDEV